MDEINKAIEFAEHLLTEEQISIIDESIPKSSYGLSLNMGSGKTFISLMTVLKKKKIQNNLEPAIVLVSKSLISSWEIEIKKFFGNTIKYQILTTKFDINVNTMFVIITPDLVGKYYTKYEIDNKFIIKEPYDDGGPFMRVKNTYGSPKTPYIINSVSGYGSIIFSKKWSALIVDEAHKFTKISTSRCQAICSICSDNRLLLSGTLFDEPDPERLLGYYLMLHDKHFPKDLPQTIFFLKHGFCGTKNSIITREALVLDVKVNKIVIEHNLNKEETKIYISMKDTLKILKNYIKKLSTTNSSDKKKFSTYILAMVIYLRQSIVCPILPIANIVLEMSEFKEDKSELSIILNNQFKKLNINNFLENEQSLKSSRIKEVMKTISSHNNNNDKIVVFSCFRTCLNILKHFVNEEIPINIYMLESSMSINKRGKLIAEFKEDSENSILFTTYELGAEGLNLQFANTVIILDFWWNTGKTQQAISRVVRYGQMSKEVNIYYYTSNTGIEKSLFIKHKDKLVCLNELKDGPMISKIKNLSMIEIIKLIDSNENSKYLKNIY